MFELITAALAWAEHNLLLAVAAVFLAVNVLVLAVLTIYVKLYGGLPEGAVRRKLHQIVFEIDRACDNMENPTKRAMAMIQLQQVLGWKRVFLPSAIIGWIIDAEVAAIRKMQAATGVPDLHQEGGQTDGQNNA